MILNRCQIFEIDFALKPEKKSYHKHRCYLQHKCYFNHELLKFGKILLKLWKEVKLLHHQNLLHTDRYPKYNNSSQIYQCQLYKSEKGCRIFNCLCLHIMRSTDNDDPFSRHTYSKINNWVDKILHFADFTMVSSWKFYTVTFKAIAQFGQGFYIAKAVLILARV